MKDRVLLLIPVGLILAAILSFTSNISWPQPEPTAQDDVRQTVAAYVAEHEPALERQDVCDLYVSKLERNDQPLDATSAVDVQLKDGTSYFLTLYLEREFGHWRVVKTQKKVY